MHSNVTRVRRFARMDASPTRNMRIARFGGVRNGPLRYVRVEAMHRSRPLAIIFFRHNDGSWCVFPPDGERLSMNIAFPAPLPERRPEFGLYI
jgi:hypothetical protein